MDPIGNSAIRNDAKRKQVSKKKKNQKKARTSTTTTSGVCENVSDRYEKVGRVGEGTYGVVYKAKDLQTGDYVALKRCIPHHENSDGFPLTTLREIQALRVCSQHPNVITLQTVAVSTNGVFLVFDYCSQDIAQILDSYYPKHHQSPFDESECQSLVQQLLSALEFCHSHSLLHRDIKPSNLLYDDDQGVLQLADFGLARFSSTRCLTPNVVSLWYRAPELLLKRDLSTYTSAIDLWAVGCVMAELLQGYPLLDGKSEVDQIHKMVQCLGKPPYGNAGDTSLKSSGSDSLLDRFDFLPTEGLKLLTKLLDYQPSSRWTAEQALSSLYFQSPSSPPRY